MNKAEFERARGALAQALGVAAPILQALQHTSTAFDFMANAVVHKDALEKDVAKLQGQVAAETERLTLLAGQAAEREAAVDAAENEAKTRIREAAASIDAGVADARTQLQGRVDTLRVQTDARLAEISEAAVKAEHAHAVRVGELAAERTALETETAALEKKLASLKSSAQKFADALKG